MWHVDGREWNLHRPRFLGEEADPERAAGPWFGHRWFAYDLIRWGRPEVIVELGTHYGVSFFSFCQAVLDEGYPAALHAVDTWMGDEHAGFYEDDVIDVVRRIRGDHYPDLEVTLHRCLFSEALAEVPDGSVDLLHIDGFHTYDAVKDDFETWYPKLADNGVVLFHDVAPDTGYGSADYWAEIAARHPSVTFLHSCGLGVLAPKGTDGIEFAFGEEFGRWQAYYENRSGAYFGALSTETQARMIDARDETIRAQEHHVEELIAYVADLETRIGILDDWVAERDRALAPSSRIGSRALPGPLAGLVGRARSLGTGRPASTRAERLLREVIGASVSRVPSSISSVFDADFYRATNPDVRRSRHDPLVHYRRFGWGEQRDPNPLFDTSWYLRERPDVVAAGAEPFRHYLVHGWREGMDPSPVFSSEWYLAHNSGARESGVSPLEYYWNEGWSRGEFVHPEHRRRTLAVAGPAQVLVRNVAGCVLTDPDGTDLVADLADLASVDVDLVTFDLWDTLVARRRPADAAKLATARRMLIAHGDSMPEGTTPWSLMVIRVEVEAAIARSTAHEEYRLAEVLAKVLVDVAGLGKRESRKVAEVLASVEADEEAATTYPVDAVADLFERLSVRPDGPRLAVISDFYIGAEGLRKVLTANGYPPDLALYVSCDLEASKRRDGGLFELVRREFGVDAGRHLHVGDNPWADRHQQVETGGWSALVELTPSGYPGPGELDPMHVEDLVGVLERELRTLVPVVVPAGPERVVRAGQAGVCSALLPVALVAGAIEAAVTQSAPRVLYASREGAFLRRVHEVVAPVLFAERAPDGVHLPCSRRATFAASLDDASPAGLGRLWSQYSSQSPRALFASLGLDPESLRADVEAAGLTLDDVVEGIADDRRVARLLERPRVVEAVATRNAEQRTALRGFAEPLLGAGPTSVVVDVGWRGTIQDNLARVFPERRWVGVYLGLFPFLNPQPPNVTKTAVAFDGNLGHDFGFVDPPAAVEGPWTPDLPSVVGYRESAGEFEAVHEPEGPRSSAAIAAFQDAVVEVAPVVAAWMVTNGLTAAMLRPALANVLRRYYEEPWGGVADIWFDSTHDDTFGAFNASPYGKLRAPRSILVDAAVPGPALPHPPTPEEADSRWAAGYRAWLPVRALSELRALRRELP